MSAPNNSSGNDRNESKSKALARIDQSKSIIDLTASLVNASNSSNPLINGAVEVFQWLGREGLDKNQLAACLEQANGVSYPNEIGLKYYDRVKSAIATNPVNFLFLQKSGSLGKLMLRDPQLRWMVSTAACLYRFTGETKMVTNTICYMILRHKSSKSDGLGHDRAGLPPYRGVNGEVHTEFEKRIQQSKMLLRPVIDKVVSSIWLNIVNTQTDTIDLPRELQKICPRGHNLGERSLYQIMHMSNKVPEKVIIESTYFLSNMTLWLLVHFRGTIVVVVGTEKVYEQSGAVGEEIEIRVKRSCDLETPCRASSSSGRSPDLDSYAVKVFHKFSTKPFLIFDGAENVADVRIENPGTRQSLYDLPWLTLADEPMFNKEMRNEIQMNAQVIMTWLLDRHVLRHASRSPLGFIVTLQKQNECADPNLRVSDIIYKIPDLINGPWAGNRDHFPSIVYSPPDEYVGDWAPDDLKTDPSDAPKWPAYIVCCFPMLQDLIAKARRRCSCRTCNMKSDIDPLGWKLKRGCLRQRVFDSVMLMLAHGIADSVGCDSASGGNNTGEAESAAMAVLCEICVEHKTVHWNSWIMTAATVYLGCKYIPQDFRYPDSRPYAAIQYGDLCLVAPWLDLHKEVKIPGCFRAILGNGRLSANGGGSIQEDFAVIEIAETQPSSSNRMQDQGSADEEEEGNNGQPSSEKEEEDESRAEGELFLIPSERGVYNLAYRIRTDNHSRFIDPSQRLVATMQLRVSRQCHHEQPKLAYLQHKGRVKAFTFDDIIGCWPEEAQFAMHDVHLFASSILESRFKYNAALCLLPNYTISSTGAPICDACLAAIMNDENRPTASPDYQWILREAPHFRQDRDARQRMIDC